jgi:hypothetical protein
MKAKHLLVTAALVGAAIYLWKRVKVDSLTAAAQLQAKGLPVPDALKAEIAAEHGTGPG